MRVYTRSLTGDPKRLQATLAVGTTQAPLAESQVGGATAPATNGFVSAGYVAGTVESAATGGASGDPLAYFDGAGQARFAKLSQAGSATAVQTASTTGTVDVVFDVAFDAAPAVTVSPVQTSVYLAAAVNITTTGFTAQVRRFDNASVTANTVVSWIAHAK